MTKSVEDILKETEKIGDFFEKKLGTKKYNEILDRMSENTENCEWCDHTLDIHTDNGCSHDFCSCLEKKK